MKRDLELFRAILLRIQDTDAIGKFEDYDVDANTFDGHIALLLEAGMIEGVEFSEPSLTDDGRHVWYITGWLRLTNHGHEFLAVADPSTWEKAKTQLKGAGRDLGQVTIGVLQGLLTRIAELSLNL